MQSLSEREFAFIEAIDQLHNALDDEDYNNEEYQGINFYYTARTEYELDDDLELHNVIKSFSDDEIKDLYEKRG